MSMYRFLCELKFSFPLGRYKGVELLSHITLLETANCFPKWLYHFASPLRMGEITTCSTFSTPLGLLGILKFIFNLFVFSYFIYFWPSCMAHKDFSLPTRDWTWVTAVNVLSPNHQTSREFPFLSYFNRCIVLSHCGFNLHFSKE